MKFLTHRVTKILLHVLFWPKFIILSLYVFPNHHWTESPFIRYFPILVGIVYINYLFFQPFFVKRRLYILYVVLIVTTAILATLIYCSYFASCDCTIDECLTDYLWQTLVPLIFFSFVWMLFRFLEKHDELERIKKEHTEMELHLLKSQINPHILFNNLNTVYSYALEKPDEVANMVLMLSNNLKHVIYESNALTVDLKKELDYIDNFMSFQKIREENIKEVNYQKDIDDPNHQIAPLLLITLIENVFKHSGPQNKVDIMIKVRDSILNFDCQNEIKTSQEKNKNPQIGLKNLKKRLSLLYKNKHDLHITEDGVFHVRLKLELS